MPNDVITARPEPVTADHVYVCISVRGRKVFDEVLCQQHFEEMRLQGAYDSLRNDVIEMVPWQGAPRCSVCEDHEA